MASLPAGADCPTHNLYVHHDDVVHERGDSTRRFDTVLGATKQLGVLAESKDALREFRVAARDRGIVLGLSPRPVLSLGSAPSVGDLLATLPVTSKRRE